MTVLLPPHHRLPTLPLEHQSCSADSAGNASAQSPSLLVLGMRHGYVLAMYPCTWVSWVWVRVASLIPTGIHGRLQFIGAASVPPHPLPYPILEWLLRKRLTLRTTAGMWALQMMTSMGSWGRQRKKSPSNVSQSLGISDWKRKLRAIDDRDGANERSKD